MRSKKKAIRYPKRLLSSKHPAMRGASVTLILETERQLKKLLQDPDTDAALKDRLLATSVRLIQSMNAAAASNQQAISSMASDQPTPSDEDNEESVFADWAPEIIDNEEEEDER